MRVLRAAGAVLLVMAALDAWHQATRRPPRAHRIGTAVAPFPWFLVMFLGEGVYCLCAARALQTDSRMAGVAADAAFGGVQLARWAKAGVLFFGGTAHTIVGAVVFVTYFVLAPVAAATRAASARLGAAARRFHGVLCVASCLLLAFALAQAHTNEDFRGRVKFRHNAHDFRLLHAGLSQAAYAAGLWPLAAFLPVWMVEAWNLVTWLVLFLAKGHAHLP